MSSTIYKYQKLIPNNNNEDTTTTNDTKMTDSLFPSDLFVLGEL